MLVKGITRVGKNTGRIGLEDGKDMQQGHVVIVENINETIAFTQGQGTADHINDLVS